MTSKHFIHNPIDGALYTSQWKAVLFDEHLVWGDAPLVFNGLCERPHQWTGMINLNNERASKAVSRGSTPLATGSVAPLDPWTLRWLVPFGLLSDLWHSCHTVQWKGKTFSVMVEFMKDYGCSCSLLSGLDSTLLLYNNTYCLNVFVLFCF